jgi:hypothetical protein
MQHEDEDATVVTDDEGSDCPCIHWTAATIIQTKFRGWFRFICYKEFVLCRQERLPVYQRIYMARVGIALRLQKQWQRKNYGLK